jgi:hypothetical protein
MTMNAAIIATATIPQKSGKKEPFVGCTRHISAALRRSHELFNKG